ncbi:phosphonate C-P lyase system protein PhnG [Calothrix rhizosoleniae]|uniref:phosphonate C-P lyase system protein PhnG n=1 Tax=Calothrix rhizosoleniae TaxID=888997 RepID=UPI000B496F46|nr:phosphonate C-P lyase system protein PhnG [Calothrix rhizosoleniae]
MEQVDNQWLRALTAHAPEVVIQLTARLTQGWQISYETVPQTGLSLLQLQDSVFHEPYYLGEIPLSTAWVKLKIGNGQNYEGAAQVMNDVPNLATSLAICDAILNNQLEGWQEVTDLIHRGRVIRQEEDKLRGAMLAKTKVDFSLLNQEESDARS